MQSSTVKAVECGDPSPFRASRTGQFTEPWPYQDAEVLVCVCGLPGKDSNSSLVSREPCTGGRANRQTDRQTGSQRDGQDEKEIEQVWFDSASALTLARWILCIIRERLVVIGRLGTWSERQDLAVPIAKQEPCPVTPGGRGTGRRGGTSKAGVPSETLNPAELGVRSTVCPSTSSLMSWVSSSAVLLFGSDPVRRRLVAIWGRKHLVSQSVAAAA